MKFSQLLIIQGTPTIPSQHNDLVPRAPIWTYPRRYSPHRDHPVLQVWNLRRRLSKDPVMPQIDRFPIAQDPNKILLEIEAMPYYKY